MLDGRQKQPLIRGRPTVVLLHGMAPHPFFQRFGPASLSGLQHYLQEHGSNALLETYAAGDLRVAGRFLTAGIEALAAELEEPVQLIGHSTGGLLALAVAQSVPHAVGRVVMVAAPYGGLSIAGYLSVARQLMPGSPYLQELASRGIPGGVEAVSIYGVQDPIVPPESAAVPGTHQLPLADAGHFAPISPAYHHLLDAIVKSPLPALLKSSPMP